MARSSYGELLRTPSVAWLLVSSLVARVPIGMEGLAIVLAVTHAGGSYTRAGAVTATVVCLAGVASPIFGRAADRVGRRRILRVLAVANAGAAIGLAFAITAPTPILFLVAGVVGATSPPVIPTMRAAWSGLVTGAARESAYALEATAQELQFIVGPSFAALLAATISPRAAVAATGTVGLVGIFAMTRTDAVEAREEAVGAAHRGSALRVGALRRCMCALGLLVLALGCIEIAVVAAVSPGRQASAFAGVVIALWSVGSMVGGFWYGSRTNRRFPAAVSVALVTLSFGILSISDNRAVLVCLLIIGGTTVAPMFGRMYAEVSAVAPPSVITEAYGWISVANLAGLAVGAPLGGYLVGATSPRVAFLVSAGASALATVIVIGLRTPTSPATPAPYETAIRTGP